MNNLSNIEEINCYTDASHSNIHSIAIIGYKIHDENIQSIILENVKNTQAELYGIKFCIEYSIQNYPNIKIINIYTDCQGAFTQDYSEYNITINLIKVKGHQQMIHMNSNDLVFKSVDKFARKQLRNIVKKISNK